MFLLRRFARNKYFILYIKHACNVLVSLRFQFYICFPITVMDKIKMYFGIDFQDFYIYNFLRYKHDLCVVYLRLFCTQSTAETTSGFGLFITHLIIFGTRRVGEPNTIIYKIIRVNNPRSDFNGYKNVVVKIYFHVRYCLLYGVLVVDCRR